MMLKTIITNVEALKITGKNKDSKMSIVPKVKLLNEFAKVPKKGSPEAAGYDICASHLGSVSHGHVSKFGTGVAIEIPPGYVGFVMPRSGLAFKNGIDTLAGVIDSDYRGEIKIAMTCHDIDAVRYIDPGERIAQLIIQKVENKNDFEVIEEFSRETERGKNGFGSTGRD